MLSTNATKSMNIIKTNQFNQANRAWQNESNQIQNDKAYISTDNDTDNLISDSLYNQHSKPNSHLSKDTHKTSLN